MFGKVLRSLAPAPKKRRSTNSTRRALSVESLERRDLLAAGVLVSPLRGLTTSEDGGAALISFKLTERPTADVTVSIASSNVKEGVPSLDKLVFTPDNFNVVQKVRVTGQPDGVKDGNQVYQLITDNASSGDPAYNGFDVPDVTLTNKDSRKLVAGITVKKTSGLTTTEDGGTATFTVKLNFRPTADVTIPIASDNPAEGVANVTKLVFTPGNFDRVQTVTVTGQPDGVRDGTKTYHIVTGPAVSDDPLYNDLDAADVTVKNSDSKKLVAGIEVTPTKGLKTDEMGGIAPFTIVLTYRPTSDVTIPLSSSNTAEGVPHVASVTFAPQDWNMPKQVMVLGRDDGIFDGDTKYTIITGPAQSTDPLYAGMDAADVSVINRARQDVSRFDGEYEGTYTGKVSVTGFGTYPIPPTRVYVRIYNGIVTVLDPPGGTGSITSTGIVGFGMTSGSVQGATFKGVIKGEKGTANASAMGTWKRSQPGISASGFWNIHRVAELPPGTQYQIPNQ